jgi:hypothetical protein
VALKSVYLVARTLFGWARPPREDAVAKDVEILFLRHQLAVASAARRRATCTANSKEAGVQPADAVHG